MLSRDMVLGRLLVQFGFFDAEHQGWASRILALGQLLQQGKKV
jgi:hypothetical protein